MNLATFKIIKRKDLPKGSNLIDTGFIHKLKTTGDSSEDFAKSRLVGRGYDQKFGIDFFESYSSTIDPVVIRAMVALSVQKIIPLVQADVETAFLQANFKYKGEVVFSRPPPGFKLGYQWVGNTPWWDNDNEIAFQWLKPTYGFVQAGNAWNHCLGNILTSLGFTQQKEVDPCLFVKKSENKITHILAYHVDDALIMGSGGDKIVTQISKLVPMKNLGRPTKFLGVEFKYYPGGNLKLHKRSYLNELFDRFPVDKTKQSPTASFRLNSAGEPLSPNAPYREAVGGLLWAAIMTRPEIMYSVLQLAQFSSNPKTHHWGGIEQVLMYLKGILILALALKGLTTQPN